MNQEQNYQQFSYSDLNFKEMSQEELMNFIMSQSALVVAQSQQVSNIYNNMKLIQEEVKNNKIEITETKEEIKQLKNEIIDEIHLDDGQAGDLKNKVEKKTIELCVEKHGRNNFYRSYRYFILRIWGKLKRDRSVNRYTNIKRKDFDYCMNFVDSITLKEIDYESDYQKFNAA